MGPAGGRRFPEYGAARALRTSTPRPRVCRAGLARYGGPVNTASRVVLSRHAERRLVQHGILRADVEDVLLVAEHPRRRSNTRLAAWLVSGRGITVAYNWPDGGDDTTASVGRSLPDKLILKVEPSTYYSEGDLVYIQVRPQRPGGVGPRSASGGSATTTARRDS